MKKNLKKLISTIAALAIAVSCVPAFAADFTDVADTADYKAAVDNIVALGIAQGNPDGTFAPENLIKRSEAAKMIVGTMGPAMMNAAAAAQGVTGFSDVPANHWASGFIVQGVSKGYINGMGDGTFAPDANVTYGQIVKMLVCVLGYEEDAEAAGGWNGGGYLSQGGALGVTEGFDNYPQDKAVNRGEVAMLINNALTIPVKAVVDYTTGFEMDENGNLKTVMVPVMEIMNGKKGNDYETLLTTYFEAYAVRGRITNTDKKVKGVITYQIEYSKNFEDKEYNMALDNYGYWGGYTDVQTNFPATVDVDELLGTYTNAIIMVNEDEEYELVSIESYGKNDIVELSSELYYDHKASIAADYKETVKGDDPATTDKVESEYQVTVSKAYGNIEFYKDSESSRKDDYKLDYDVQYFVNGKQASAAAINAYVKGNETTSVKLVDTPEEGRNTIDGIYDYVMLSVYTSATVDEVLADEEEVEIFLENLNTNVLQSSISVKINLDDVEDGDAVYTLVDTEGNEVEFEALEKDDVITIYTDFISSVTPLANAESIDMVVSKNTVEGAVGENNPEKYQVKVDGEFYGFAHDEQNNYKAVKVGESYTLFLDMFGKIVKTEQLASTVNYGIINRVWQDNGGDNRVRLVNADGEIVSYIAKDNDAYTEAMNLYKKAFESENVNGTALAFDNATAYNNLVVTYKINASDKIYEVKAVGLTSETAEYSENSTKIGSAKMSDLTKVIDFTAVKAGKVAWNGSLSGQVGAGSLDSFEDDDKYTVLYGGEKMDGKYPLVIILVGEASIKTSDAVAVVKSNGKSVNDADGITYDSVTALVGHEEVKLYFDKDPGLVKGDVFVYTLDNEGLVDEYYELFAAAADYDTFAKMAAAKYVATKTVDGKLVPDSAFDEYITLLDKSATYGTKLPDAWKAANDGDEDANVGFGVLVGKIGSELVIGKMTTNDDGNGKYETKIYEEVSLASDVNVYVYDASGQTATVTSSTTAALQATRIGSLFSEKDEAGSELTNSIYRWEDAGKSKVNTVFYKTFEDEITDIILVKPE